jgi:hypothetical protein
LFVDEESTWHKSDHGRTKTLTDFYTKTTQKGGFSKLCVKIKKRCYTEYEYCAGKHWIFYWIQENKTATYFLRSRLFMYDIMKNFNCN